MRKRLEQLLCVKSIVTLMLTAAFIHLVIVGRVSGQEFMTVFTMVVSFYFGTQVDRDNNSSQSSQ